MSETNKNDTQKSEVKNRLHRRNRHKTKYNFPKLIQQTPDLEKHVGINKYGKEEFIKLAKSKKEIQSN